jgi:hypothetical protein
MDLRVHGGETFGSRKAREVAAVRFHVRAEAAPDGARLLLSEGRPVDDDAHA